MPEVGSTGGANANVETFAFARDSVGALHAFQTELPAATSQHAEAATAASDPTTAFAVMYARFSSGSQMHGRIFDPPGAPHIESTSEDSGGARAASGHDSVGTCDSPQTSSQTAASASETTLNFAAYALTPQTPSIDSAAERPKRERGRHREPEQREEIEPEKPGYTIDDIVQFAGVTVAERHTQLIDLATRS